MNTPGTNPSLTLIRVSIGLFVAASLTAAAAAQQCNCSCQDLINPQIVNQVLLNENGANPTTYLGAGSTALQKHANLFNATMTITHVCIAVNNSVTGHPGQIIISRQDPGAGGLPGLPIHTTNFVFNPQPNLSGSLHQVVPLTQHVPVTGPFWVELAHPNAQNGVIYQGARARTNGNSAVFVQSFVPQWDYYDNIGQYTGLAPIIRPLNLSPPPQPTCINGSDENEPNCGQPTDTVNGGCTSTPPQFVPIDCHGKVCGTAMWDPINGSRDEDWYTVTVTSPTTLTWTVHPQFPADISILQPGMTPTPCSGFSVLATASVPANQTSKISASVGPGEYWMTISPTMTAAPVTCGTEYVVTLTCCDVGEPESCGSLVNDACLPGVPSALACGQTVCGTAWADAGSRDTDWYEFQLGGTGTPMVFLHMTSAVPVRLELHDSSCQFPPLIYNAINVSANTPETIAAGVPAPGTYHVFVQPLFVSGHPCAGASHYALTLECPQVTPPPNNDDCINAGLTLLTPGGSFSYDSTGATTDGPPEPCGFNGINDADVWFTFIFQCTGTATISLTSGFNHLIAAYSTCPHAGLAPLACASGAGPLPAVISFHGVAGQAVIIRAGGMNGATGVGTMQIDFQKACPASIVPAPCGSGTVGVPDLLAIISQWGACSPPCPRYCPADINHDCNVGVPDLLAVISSWGPCP